MRLPIRPLFVTLACATAACGGTSTGNPIQNPQGGPGIGEETGAGNCKEVSASEVTVSEQTALGFSAAEVLAFVEGAHEETLSWHPQTIASYGPENGEHALTLTITRAGTPRLTKYTVDTSRGEIWSGDCTDALEIDVQVKLVTDGGALNEQLDATILARSARVANLSLSPDPKKLGGSFAITQINAPGYALVQFFLNLSFNSFGTSGTLTPVFEKRTGDSVGTGPSSPLASWGPARCDSGGSAVPRDAEIAGFSGDDVIALVNRKPSVSVQFDGAAPATASFAFAPSSASVCALLEREPIAGLDAIGTLYISGTLDLKSADGRIDAHWPVVLSARPGANDALERVEVSFDDRRPQGPAEGSLQARYGVSGVDLSSYDFFSASLKLSAAPASPLQGELRVTGYALPNCPTTVTMEPGGGSSTPACPGATPSDVARALISAGP